MKKKFILILTSLLMILMTAFSITKVKADDQNLTNAQPPIIDSITTNATTARLGEDLSITVNFSEKARDQIQPGDYIDIKLPAALTGYDKTANLVNSDGQVLGKVIITNSQARIQFNNAVDSQTLQNIKGWFTFKVRANDNSQGTTTTIEGNKTIHTITTHWGVPNVKPPKIAIIVSDQGSGNPTINTNQPRFNKTGRMQTDGKAIQWQLYGVTPQGKGTVTITDELSKGQIFNANDLTLALWNSDGQVTSYSLSDFESIFGGKVTTSNTSPETVKITFNASAVNSYAWSIYYTSKITDDSLSSYENTAKISYENTDDKPYTQQVTKTVSNSIDDGISGDLIKDGVILYKVNTDGQALKDAKFELTGNGLTKVATSNANGKVEFTDLKNNATYTIKEITAPTGYQKYQQPITVKIVDDKAQVTVNGQPLSDNKVVDQKIASSSVIASSSSKKSSSSSSIVASLSSKKNSSSSSIATSSSSKKNSSSSNVESSSSSKKSSSSSSIVASSSSKKSSSSSSIVASSSSKKSSSSSSVVASSSSKKSSSSSSIVASSSSKKSSSSSSIATSSSSKKSSSSSVVIPAASSIKSTSVSMSSDKAPTSSTSTETSSSESSEITTSSSSNKNNSSSDEVSSNKLSSSQLSSTLSEKEHDNLSSSITNNSSQNNKVMIAGQSSHHNQYHNNQTVKNNKLPQTGDTVNYLVLIGIGVLLITIVPIIKLGKK